MTITLFEHQARSYESLGWSTNHPAVNELERLNKSCGEEMLRLGRGELRASHFVGVLRTSTSTIQILPKIDYDPDGNAEAEQGSARLNAEHSAMRNLLYMLSYTRDLQVREQDVASLLTQSSDWFELLTRLFASDLHRLMQRGMDRSYVFVEDTLPVMRGRWEIGRQLTRRPHVRHLFDVVYDEFSSDTPLNRVFRHVVDRLLPRSQNLESRRMLRDLRDWMSEVGSREAITAHHLDRAAASITRLNNQFLPAFNIARMFIENEALQLTAGSKDVYAFVFDMNVLFEEFIARFISRHKQRVLPTAWRTLQVETQSRGNPLYLADRLPNRGPAFRLRPDLLLKSPSGKVYVILDTKYKRLKASDGQPSSSEDVYQMLAYSTRLSCPRVVLLYPQQAGAESMRLEYEIKESRDRFLVATVNLRRPLIEPNGLIDELKGIVQPLASNTIEEEATYG
jgi:5-methylcytosine-specific restriction enzyme subunit McrC